MQIQIFIKNFCHVQCIFWQVDLLIVKKLLGELFFIIVKRRVFVPLISVCRNQPFEQGSPKRGKTCARACCCCCCCFHSYPQHSSSASVEINRWYQQIMHLDYLIYSYVLQHYVLYVYRDTHIEVRCLVRWLACLQAWLHAFNAGMLQGLKIWGGE